MKTFWTLGLLAGFTTAHSKNDTCENKWVIREICEGRKDFNSLTSHDKNTVSTVLFAEMIMYRDLLRETDINGNYYRDGLERRINCLTKTKSLLNYENTGLRLTPLMFAAKHYIPFSKMKMIVSRSNVNHTNAYGENALHILLKHHFAPITHNHDLELKVTKLLVRNKIDLTQMTNSGSSTGSI